MLTPQAIQAVHAAASILRAQSEKVIQTKDDHAAKAAAQRLIGETLLQPEHIMDLCNCWATCHVEYANLIEAALPFLGRCLGVMERRSFEARAAAQQAAHEQDMKTNPDLAPEPEAVASNVLPLNAADQQAVNKTPGPSA